MGRFKFTGADLYIVLSVFETITSISLIWSKIKWSLSDISAG
jgi:hypothetical protein